MKRKIIVPVVVVFVLGLLSIAGWANWQNRKQVAAALAAQNSQAMLVADSATTGHMVSPLVGKPAPSFTLTTLAGKKVSLADYKGKEVLGVSFDDLDKDDPKLLAKDKAEIAKGVEQLKIPYPVLLDGDSIAKAYGDTDVYPTSYFVDKSGTVVAASFGLTSKSDLEDNIRKAIGEGK